jgi:Protein of unknown function (DUF559)
MEPVARTRAGYPGISPPASDRPLVLDFYCAKARLAIEIDGASHDMGDRPQRDQRRDDWLGKHGITVLRIAARDLARIDEVADAITRMAEEMAPPERPLHRPRKSGLPRLANYHAHPGEAPDARAVPLPRFAGEDSSEQAATSAHTHSSSMRLPCPPSRSPTDSLVALGRVAAVQGGFLLKKVSCGERVRARFERHRRKKSAWRISLDSLILGPIEARLKAP